MAFNENENENVHEFVLERLCVCVCVRTGMVCGQGLLLPQITE